MSEIHPNWNDDIARMTTTEVNQYARDLRSRLAEQAAELTRLRAANKALAEVEGALPGILQETEGGEVLSGLGGGWIGDAIYGGIELADADELLRHLGLTVRDENDGE